MAKFVSLERASGGVVNVNVDLVRFFISVDEVGLQTRLVFTGDSFVDVIGSVETVRSWLDEAEQPRRP